MRFIYRIYQTTNLVCICLLAVYTAAINSKHIYCRIMESSQLVIWHGVIQFLMNALSIFFIRQINLLLFCCFFTKKKLFSSLRLYLSKAKSGEFCPTVLASEIRKPTRVREKRNTMKTSPINHNNSFGIQHYSREKFVAAVIITNLFATFNREDHC